MLYTFWFYNADGGTIISDKVEKSEGKETSFSFNKKKLISVFDINKYKKKVRRNNKKLQFIC